MRLPANRKSYKLASLRRSGNSEKRKGDARRKNIASADGNIADTDGEGNAVLTCFALA